MENIILYFFIAVFIFIIILIGSYITKEDNKVKNHSLQNQELDSFNPIDKDEQNNIPDIPEISTSKPIQSHEHCKFLISSQFMLDCVFNKFVFDIPVFKIQSYNKSQEVCVYKAEHISLNNIHTDLTIKSEMLNYHQVKKIRSNSGVNLEFYTHNLVGDGQREIVEGDKVYISLMLPSNSCMIIFGFEFKQINNKLLAEKISEDEEHIDTTLLQNKSSLAKRLKDSIERFELIEESLGISLDSIGFEITQSTLDNIEFNLSLEIKLIDFENNVTVDVDITLFDENNTILNNSWVRNVNLSSTAPFSVQIWGLTCSKLPTRIRIFPKGKKF